MHSALTGLWGCFAFRLRFFAEGRGACKRLIPFTLLLSVAVLCIFFRKRYVPAVWGGKKSSTQFWPADDKFGSFKKNVFLSSGIWWGRNLQRFAFLLPTEHYRCRFSDFCKTAVCDGLFFPSLAGFDNAGFSLFLNFFVWDRKFFNRSVFAGGKKQVLSRFFNRFSSLIGYLRIFTDIFVIMKRRQIRSLAAKYPAICSFGRPAAKCGLPKANAGQKKESDDRRTQKTLTQEWKKTRDQRS